MSCFYGSKNYWFLTDTTISIVERCKKSLGDRFFPECNHAKESHTCRYCFLLNLQYHGLLRSRNFASTGIVT